MFGASSPVLFPFLVFFFILFFAREELGIKGMVIAVLV